jgi:prophage maintenance system killer protein
MNMQQNIAIYQNEEGNINVEVKIINDDLWLTQKQIAQLFSVKIPAINKHLKNIFNSGELEEESVISILETTAEDGKKYKTNFYNLDVIIATGYRVSSREATQFRIWSSKVLKEYIKNDYVINHNKLNQAKLDHIQQSIELLANTLERQTLIDDMGVEILNIIKEYSKTWDILLRYDEDRLTKPKNNQHDLVTLDFNEALKAIEELKADLLAKKEASHLFGNMKDNQLEGILAGLNQSFAEEFLYPSNVERAAHLLYFVIKDHPFSDGNKRIGCLLFLMYLYKTRIITPENNSLIAMALLVAESDPKQKELIIQLIMNLMS